MKRVNDQIHRQINRECSDPVWRQIHNNLQQWEIHTVFHLNGRVSRIEETVRWLSWEIWFQKLNSL